MLLAAFSSTAGVTAPANSQVAWWNPAVTMRTDSSGVRITAPVSPVSETTSAPACTAALSACGPMLCGSGSTTSRDSPDP